MSIPADDSDADGTAARPRLLMVMLRVLAALSACMALVALWSVERTEVAHDLQLASAERARPGEQLAVRALLFRDVDGAAGPSLVTAPTSLHLLDAQGRELRATTLTPSVLSTLDGAIGLPTSRTGAHVLEARTRYEGKLLTCRRGLEIADDAPPEPLHGREAGPLQQLSLGRIRVLGQATAPDPLLPRVVGGACVPEQPCRMLVWVGAPAAELTARVGAGVTLIAPAPVGETSGLVALTVMVRGLDAQLTLQAHRGGERIAERDVRLPIGLGEVAIDAEGGSLKRSTLELRFVPPPGRAHVIADLFAAGRWSATRVIADAGSGPSSIDVAALPAGLVRVQARADRFGGEGAGARVFYLMAPGENAARALPTLVRELAHMPALSAEPTRRWTETLPTFARAEPAVAAEFLLAPLEQLRAPVALPASGRPHALRRLERTRLRMRYGVALALVLSTLVISASMARRGLSATDQAELILAAERGVGVHTSRGERLRARALVLVLVLAVAGAFLAGALLIVAKPLWF